MIAVYILLGVFVAIMGIGLYCDYSKRRKKEKGDK